MDTKHYIALAKSHLDQLDDYEDWQADLALRGWVGLVVDEALADGNPKLADRLRLDGRTTTKAAVRKALAERVKLLERAS